jgi:hypothetical protein
MSKAAKASRTRSVAEVASPLARDDVSPSGITLMRDGSAPTRRKVNASMMHHSRRG